jgi:hypothetical protein
MIPLVGLLITVGGIVGGYFAFQAQVNTRFAHYEEKLKAHLARIIEMERHATDIRRHVDPERDERRFQDLRLEIHDIKTAMERGFERLEQRMERRRGD